MEVILITGASSGIGYTTTRILAQKGYKVYGGARRTERMEPLKEYGVVPLSLDVTDEKSSKAAVEYVIKEEGRIDVLMNNAGYGSYGPVEVTSFSEAQNQLDVNVFGLARMMQLVLPYMRKQRAGKIINISSIGGRLVSYMGGWYHASKFAVEALSDAVRMEVADFGIDRFAMYKRLVCPLVVNVVKSDMAVSISLEYDLPVPTMPRFALLSEQLVILNMIRTGTGRAVVPIKVSGPYLYGDVISRELGVEPEISENNIIQFSLEDMLRPFLTQNNSMWSYLEPELNRRIGELSKEQSFTSLVEKTLYSAIPGNRYSREETARTLGVSVRTMQRKLSENNTTYAELVQKVQKLLAINYIRIDELSLEEISCLLGYKEQTSFSRAFKSWTGQTFTEYRMDNCGREA